MKYVLELKVPDNVPPQQFVHTVAAAASVLRATGYKVTGYLERKEHNDEMASE